MIWEFFIVKKFKMGEKKENELKIDKNLKLFENDIFLKNGLILEEIDENFNKNVEEDKIPIKKFTKFNNLNFFEENRQKIDNVIDCLEKFKGCDITDKFSCSMCKSKKFSCVKLKSDMEIYDNAGKLIDILKANNANDNTGYCLQDITINQTRTCNPFAGDWILIRHSINKIKEKGSGIIFESNLSSFSNTQNRFVDNDRYAYVFVCKCKMPHIIGQKNFFSDCTVSRSCGTNGTLETVYINPSEAKCKCLNNDEIADKINNSPICRKKKLIELENDDLYTNSFPHKISLNHPGIDKSFSNQFTFKDKRHVINPCKIDAFTGEEIDESELVRISDDKRAKEMGYTQNTNIWYCKPMANNIMTVLYESDFLTGNNGQYANGVYRISNSQTNIEIQEWNVPFLEKFSKNSRYGPPIIGMKESIKNIQSANPNLYKLLENYYKHRWDLSQINNIYFYNFITHILAISSTIEKHTDLHSYKEHNNHTLVPLKKYFIWKSVYDGDLFDIHPRFCHTMLSDSGEDENWPKNSTNGTTDEILHMKLLKGGAFIGCILDKNKLTTKNNNLKLFLNLYDNFYILNGLNLKNTNIIEINHMLKTIEPIWLEDDTEKRKWLDKTTNGALFFLKSLTNG